VTHAVPAYDIVRWRGRRSSACVIIPVIDEGGRIVRLLARMAAARIGDIADIVIVDGGSTDGSLANVEVDGLLLKRGPGKLSAQLRCAYDFAVREGYEAVVTIDGNDKDDPAAIPAFIAAIGEGVDLVQASRFLPGGEEQHTPMKRRLAIRLVHAPALSFASGFHWTDTTQGFRAYSRRLLTDPRIAVFRDVFQTYELLPYLNYRAPRLGLRCVELPTARRYPGHGAIPTKIDVRAEFDLVRILWIACRGGYDPR
jgi:glycosyltransferase involved in cell wall biosynthesis